jgi:hypothetical protein
MNVQAWFSRTDSQSNCDGDAQVKEKRSLMRKVRGGSVAESKGEKMERMERERERKMRSKRELASCSVAEYQKEIESLHSERFEGKDKDYQGSTSQEAAAEFREKRQEESELREKARKGET